jgi:hypothetical protein
VDNVIETSLWSARVIEVLLILVAAVVCGGNRDKRPPE